MIDSIFGRPFRLTAQEKASRIPKFKNLKVEILKKVLYNQAEVAEYIVILANYMENYDKVMKELELKSCLNVTKRDIYTLPTTKRSSTKEFLMLMN
jgi:hypothetical protein